MLLADRLSLKILLPRYRCHTKLAGSVAYGQEESMRFVNGRIKQYGVEKSMVLRLFTLVCPIVQTEIIFFRLGKRKTF